MTTASSPGWTALLLLWTASRPVSASLGAEPPCPSLWQPHSTPSALLPGHYVAARCTHYLKPLLEAGTQGTRGSASVFLPHVTEAYRGPASAAASEDASYPVCTERHFPSTVEHSLQVRTLYPPHLEPPPQLCSSSNTLSSFPSSPQWAQNEFEELFRQSAETINRYQQ